jgi:hypothetical protein
MKKVSILLLLTVVVASFTFAIEGVGDFTAGLEIDLDNITGGNNGALSVDPFEITIEYARSFGAFGLSAKLGNDLRIPTDKVKNGTDKIGDDLFFKVTPSYSLAAGPGELGFALGVQLNVPFTSEGYGLSPSYGAPAENIFFRIDPAISYGLDAGFGALAFELGTDHIQISKTVADNTEFKYGLEDITLYFQAGVDLSFGLGLWVKPVLVIDATDDSKDADLFNNFVFDIHYAITEAITAGVEADIPTVEDGIKNGGITVTPYGDFSFGPIGAYVKIELSKLATDTNPSTDIQIKPIIGGSYSF